MVPISDTQIHFIPLPADSSAVQRATQLSRCEVVFLRPEQIGPDEQEQWRNLIQQGEGGTPFLTWEYVSGMLILEAADPLICVILRNGQWIGLGLFSPTNGSLRFPVPHLRSWQTTHGYLDGMIFRRGCQAEAANAFWHYLKRGKHPWHGVSFPRMTCEDASMGTLFSTAIERNISYRRGRSIERAAVNLKQTGPEELLQSMSSKRRRSMRQSWNWLNRQGNVEVKLISGSEECFQNIDRFMELEAMGWKSGCGTALNMYRNSREFFHQFAGGFAQQNRLYFVEIHLDGKAIASVVHFLTGNTSFAFKLGWNPAFARACPGFQLKTQSFELIRRHRPELEWIDSCAMPGSFIESVWPDRRELQPALFMTSKVGEIVGQLVGQVRSVHRMGKQLITIAKTGQSDD